MKFLSLPAASLAVIVSVAAHAAMPNALHDSATQEPDGKALYLKNCKQCHGVLGTPTKDAKAKYDRIASFTNAEFFATRSTDSIVTVLKKGKGRDMKSFADKLSPAEMQSVAQYIQTLAKK